MADWLIDHQAEPSDSPAAGKSYGWVDSTSKFWTTKDSSGRVFPTYGVIGTFAAADFTGANDTSEQPIFAAAQDTFTVLASTAYVMDACFHIHTTGANAHKLAIGFGGTATTTSIGYGILASALSSEAPNSTIAMNWVSATSSTYTSSSTYASATHHTIFLHGTVRVDQAGTFVPIYSWDAAPGVAGVTLANSYFMLHPIGVDTRTVVGPVA